MFLEGQYYIWEELLEIYDIETDDMFFDLGGILC